MFDTAIARERTAGERSRVGTELRPARFSVVAGLTHLNSQPRASGTETEVIEKNLVLEMLESSGSSKTAVREQLTRIVQSSIFVQSERMSRFLRFIVEHALDGNQSYLKEYVIGSEVYDRKPPYHPSQDSIVRTEARRLRGKLKEYYATDGKHDLVYIYLRPGSYAPTFQYQDRVTTEQTAAQIQGLLSSARTSEIAIAIMPFRDLSGSSLASIYARGIPDELAYTLMRSNGCKVISPSSMEYLSACGDGIAIAMSKVGAQIAFEGSVRQEGSQIRVTARIVDASGFQLWVKRFDTQVESQQFFKIEEQIASALSQGFDLLFGESQRLRAL